MTIYKCLHCGSIMGMDFSCMCEKKVQWTAQERKRLNKEKKRNAKK